MREHWRAVRETLKIADDKQLKTLLFNVSANLKSADERKAEMPYEDYLQGTAYYSVFAGIIKAQIKTRIKTFVNFPDQYNNVRPTLLASTYHLIMENDLKEKE